MGASRGSCSRLTGKRGGGVVDHGKPVSTGGLGGGDAVTLGGLGGGDAVTRGEDGEGGGELDMMAKGQGAELPVILAIADDMRCD